MIRQPRQPNMLKRKAPPADHHPREPVAPSQISLSDITNVPQIYELKAEQPLKELRDEDLQGLQLDSSNDWWNQVNEPIDMNDLEEEEPSSSRSLASNQPYPPPLKKGTNH